jgi:bifunctional DNA-binding transcriptional regulator/antitoxin component of YhaV-PrlF toxin-antitoxin module
MSDEVKGPPRRPRTTRLSSKHQATIPVAVLAEAGMRAGERLRVEALGPGRIVLTRASDSFDELVGAVDDEVYPPGYLDRLRGEWE